MQQQQQQQQQQAGRSSPRGARHGGGAGSGGGSAARGPSRLQAVGASAMGGASAGAGSSIVGIQAGSQARRHNKMVPRKPPEPLRRAVADCLSATSYHVPPLTSEAVRTFQDYLASPNTIHFAYTVLLEHAMAERDRSPPVVLKCVSLLKRYLFRYVPPVTTLQQIDLFCTSLIGEFSQPVGGHTKEVPSSLINVTTTVFASEALLKSLHYVRAIVARHLPGFSFRQPVSSSLRPPQPAVSSPRYRVNGLATGSKQPIKPALLAMVVLGSVEDDDADFLAVDILKWRWIARPGTHPWVPSPVMMDSGGIARPQVETLESLERGIAAAFLNVGPSSEGGRPDPSLASQILRTSTTMVTDVNTVKAHLRAVAASKRLEPVPHSYGTVKKRPRPLFQYRYYSKQQPLRLSDTDIEDVIAAVCSDGTIQSNAAVPLLPSLSSAQDNVMPDTASVAASVLIKLVLDMYIADAKTAAPLTLFILQGMLSSSSVAARIRAFDLVINLGIHAHLLEPTQSEDQDNICDLSGFASQRTGSADGGADNKGTPQAVRIFENWLLAILSEMLVFLVQLEERGEGVWAAAMSTLLYLVCDRGRIRRQRLEVVDIRALKTMLEISRENSWAEELHSRVVRMITNLVYYVPPLDGLHFEATSLDHEKLELLGGIEVICREYATATNSETRRNLFAVIFDYVVSELTDEVQDEVQAVVSSLILAGTPDSLSTAFRHRLPGVGARLAKSITKALDRDIANERLNIRLLEEITRRLDMLVDRHSNPEEEFAYLMSITKAGEVSAQLQERAWATLRALLHSNREEYRQLGYNWLNHLFTLEAKCVRSVQKEEHEGCLLKVLDEVNVELTRPNTSANQVFLELLKSKRSSVRRGFLVVLERVLSHCQRTISDADTKQDVVNRLLRLMDGALWHFISANDTHRVNVLEMCNVVLSQICIKLPGNADVLAESKQDGDALVLSSTSALLLRDRAAACKYLVSNMPTALFYWPLMQLAGSSMEDLTLGVAVGSKGGGNVPGATSDVRCALLLLLIGKCTMQESALEEVGGEEFFRSLLDDTDARMAYYTASFLIKRMMVEQPDVYQRMLHSLVFKAQQSNNEKLLENPYLQLRGILQLLASDANL